MSSALPESVLGGARGPVLAAAARGRRAPCVRGSRRRRAWPRRSPLVSCSSMRSTTCARRVENSAITLRGTSLEVGQTLRRRFPLDAERAGELGSELGLVEVAGGEPVGLQDRLAVERAPLAVARGLGQVADDHVRVQVRVLRTRGAVLVSGGDEPRRVLALDPAGAAADDAGLVLEGASAACQAAVCASLTARRVSSSPSACSRLTLLGTEKTRS